MKYTGKGQHCARPFGKSSVPHVPGTLIFIHIPKNAGRTFESILDRQYREGTIYTLYGYGSAIADAVNQLECMPEDEKNKIRLIKGHCQFGLHTHLAQSTSYLTFLRDPLERAVSLYHYIQRDRHHPHHAIIRNRNMSLGEYVASGLSREIDNGQVRLLSGKEQECPFGQCSGELLELAKMNIRDNFPVVGLVERFDESLVLMGLRFGWKTLWYQKKNVRGRRLLRSGLDQSTLGLIDKYSELDRQLYDFAFRRLDSMIIECRLEHGKRLASLRRENRLRAPFALLTKAIFYAKKLGL